MDDGNVPEDGKKTGPNAFCHLENRGPGCAENSRIQKRDLLRLEELGMQLGDADLEAQIRSLDRYLEELKHSMEEIREGMKVKIRLCQCLGVMGGIFVTILLI